MSFARVSNRRCPNCGYCLLKPRVKAGKPNWDCENCGLKVPGKKLLTGEQILDALNNVKFRQPLLLMMEEIHFGKTDDWFQANRTRN